MNALRGFLPGLVLAVVMLVLSAAAWADTDIQGNPTGLPNVDVRTGTLAPTAGQRADARDLQAQVAWNDFGTPSTLVRPGGALGATVAGPNATGAARAWLARNRSLFRLSS